jgi:HD-like signal output (HDOD) protein
MTEASAENPAASIKHVLFVDDDANVLAGLRNVLRGQRREWDMVFALGPEEALAKLAEQTFDVVVSDMRMPQMDGATLLSKVKQLQPKAVRMILTGQTEQESVMRSVFVAHMFLSKPCDPALLKRVVGRACHLNNILNSEELRAAVGKVEMLPAVPRTYVALNGALGRPNCSASDVARIIEGDIGLCAKILQLVNSAFFGLPRKISSVADAVTYIGTVAIRNLALALEAFASAPCACGMSQSELLALQNHSLLAGQIARRIVSQSREQSEEAFLAGILHEVGYLVPVDDRGRVVDSRVVDRSLLGAYLLGLWGLPHTITEAVAYHRDPQLLAHGECELVDAIYLAHHLANELGGSMAGESESSRLDLDYLRKVGIGSDRIQELRDAAKGLEAGIER